MATTREQFIVDEQGKQTSVALSPRRYQRLMEDLHDLAIVAGRPAEKALPVDEIRRRLKEDGARSPFPEAFGREGS